MNEPVTSTSLINNVSAVLIVKNEEHMLAECLQSLALFAEVIVYLNGCTDRSEAIALSFNNVKIVKGEFIGFGDTRNKAATAANNDWIFGIDADERCSPALAKAISELQLADPKTIYLVRLHISFLGKILRPKNWAMRIYNKNITQFERNVNESLNTFGIVKQKIPHVLVALVQPLARGFEKNRFYARLQAEAGKPRRSIPIAATLAFYRFIYHYFFDLLFLDGKPGFLFTVQIVHQHYSKYRIPAEKQPNASN